MFFSSEQANYADSDLVLTFSDFLERLYGGSRFVSQVETEMVVSSTRQSLPLYQFPLDLP